MIIIHTNYKITQTHLSAIVFFSFPSTFKESLAFLEKKYNDITLRPTLILTRKVKNGQSYNIEKNFAPS